MNDTKLKCGHTAPDWNGEGDCITCARDKVLGSSDKELREQIKQALLPGGAWIAVGDGKLRPDQVKLDAVMALIKEHSLQERIDELKSLDDEHQTTSQDLERLHAGFTQICVPCKPIWERIAQLQEERGKL